MIREFMIREFIIRKLIKNIKGRKLITGLRPFSIII